MKNTPSTPPKAWPSWYDGQNINESLFCKDLLSSRKLLYTEGTFFTENGRMVDETPLKAEIYQELQSFAVTNIPRKITNIVELLKITAYVENFPPAADRIHLSNGTLLLSGCFDPAKDEIVRSRFPVAYNPEAPPPQAWLHFLADLLHEEDIPTLQEYIGYCLIPSNKGQRMMIIKGNGGEGKSQIGTVSAIRNS